MYRGTTPKLTYEVPFDPSVTKELWITYSQNNKELFTLRKGECEFDGNKIIVRLSQEQTLSFSPNYYVEMQIRYSRAGEGFDEAQASEIMITSVKDILKDGVI